MKTTEPLVIIHTPKDCKGSWIKNQQLHGIDVK
jgi:hypothetical protein